jgi:CDP-6-deoxy-D-xylo-4-hexulose-3-dehydrase
MRTSWGRWEPGDWLTINRVVWDENELQHVQDVFDSDWFGPKTKALQLEARLASLVGVEYAQLLNSGSSALLLAVQGLMAQGKWTKGSLVLHPACTFPTSCNPIIQSGMVPVFVDIDMTTYCIDTDKIREAIKRFPGIRGAIIPHLIGNSPNMDDLLDALQSRVLIEDCCDTLGSYWMKKHVGSMGDAAAFSFYGSHHITTGGVGGALVTNDEDLVKIVKSMAFWGRRFNEGAPLLEQFTHRYSYDHLGYDMQMSEIQAAFGLAQMDRIEEIIEDRALVFFQVNKFFTENFDDKFYLPYSHGRSKPSWFGYPLMMTDDGGDRNTLIQHLLDRKIEVRPLFTGNITRQKPYRNVEKIIVGDTRWADKADNDAFFIPCWNGMTEEMLEYVFDAFRSYEWPR